MTGTLLVSEIFGPTFQGEGPHTGRHTSFLRLGLCNLDCAWCDTPFTWDWSGKNGPPQDRSALERLTVEQVVERVEAIPYRRNLVITGGEPLVQQTALVPLVHQLWNLGYTIEVETNGTLAPDQGLLGMVWWNVSPKLPHSGVPLERAWKPDLLHAWWLSETTGMAFKFVVQSPEDVELVADLVEQADLPADQVWIMPEGRRPVTLVGRQACAERALELGFNYTGRLHVMLWGDVRGR